MNVETLAICCTIIVSTLTGTWMLSSELSSLKTNQLATFNRIDEGLASLHILEDKVNLHDIQIAVLNAREVKNEEIGTNAPVDDNPWGLWYAGFRFLRDEHDSDNWLDNF